MLGELGETRETLFTLPFFRAINITREFIRLAKKKSSGKMFEIKFQIFELRLGFVGIVRIAVAAGSTKHSPHI